MTKKKFDKFLHIGIPLIILVILILLSKPENVYEKEISNKAEGEKTVIDEMGDLSELKPLDQKKEKSDFKEKEAVKNKNEKVENSQKKPVENTKTETQNEKVVEYLSQHKDSGVKAVDNVDVSMTDPSKYPTIEADFSNIRKLNFRGLKKVYTYFRLKDKFPEVVLKSLNGAAVEMTGAIMPVDRIPDDGVFPAFWLSNPVIVLAGCVFCSPPTMADIVYVSKSVGEIPFSVEREKLFKQVVLVKVTGKLIFGPETNGDQTYLFRIKANSIEVLN